MGTDTGSDANTTVRNFPYKKADLHKERTENCYEVLDDAKQYIEEIGGADEVLIWIRSGTEFRRLNTPVDDVIGLIGRIEMHKDDLISWMKS